MLIYLSMLEFEEDKIKFEKIYEKYRQIMFYVANKILKDDHLSEDAVHNAFLRIIKNIDKIDEVDSPRTKAFIVIIVERIAIDFYRKRKREKVSDIEEEYKHREINFSIEDKVCESNLAIALAKLNESYFQVLSLKFQYGFSNKEIAKVLNLGEENVYKRIQRARKKLKEILEEMEVGNIE
ncbi:sigma-70 family RNA polymerase sigma factor [Clostridioides difficile]